jgi:PD-(D/E)XK nuclease superfamily
MKTLLDGKTHYSPSQINLWIDSPGIYLMQYVFGVRDETNAAMARGTAVESGMVHLLHGATADDAVNVANANFLNQLGGELTEEIETEQKLFPGMLAQCAKWQPPGALLASQLKIEHTFPGLNLPVLGYVDLSFEPIDVDLKTTKACPSKAKPDHTRQVSLYRAARNKPGALLYVTDKKHAYYEIDDAAAEIALAELHSAALSLQRFLSKFSDPEDAIRCLPINRDSFRFSEAAKQKLEELHL